MDSDRIVANRQAETVEGYTVDLYTASGVVTLWDHMRQRDAGDKNRQRQFALRAVK